MTFWDCRTDVRMTSMTSSVERTDLDFKISVALLGSTRAPDAAYQVSGSLAFWFRRRIFSKVFTIYGQGGHLGHVTRTS